MAQHKPEYEIIEEFNDMARKLVDMYPEVLDGIDPNLIRCVAITNKEPKEGKALWELKNVPMPLRLDCPYDFYAIVNMQDWMSWDEKHQALLIMDILCSVSRDGDAKVVPFDMRDHSVMLRTVGVDYMSRGDVPDILNDQVDWKKE